MYFAKTTMYTSIFDSFFSEPCFAPHRTVYVISESQLEELKKRQHQEELDNLTESRKRLEANYQSRIKILDERETELKEELKVLAPAEKEAVKA